MGCCADVFSQPVARGYKLASCSYNFSQVFWPHVAAAAVKFFTTNSVEMLSVCRGAVKMDFFYVLNVKYMKLTCKGGTSLSIPIHVSFLKVEDLNYCP